VSLSAAAELCTPGIVNGLHYHACYWSCREQTMAFAVAVGQTRRASVLTHQNIWPTCVADVDIIFMSCGFFFFFLSFFLAYSHPLQIGCLPYFHTGCGLSATANLGCRSETCCTQLAENTGRKKIAKNSPSAHHRTTLSGYIFATKAHIDNQKKILNSNISRTRPYNMVNFGPLAAKIGSLVWGTPANFNGIYVLTALLHGTLVVGVSQTAALNRRRHLYLAGRPSRWALAHILVL